MSTILRVENLTKYFDSHLVLDGINLEVNNQDILAVIGPSGSGKSTLIRCMNMLELPSSGSIVFDGKQVIKRLANQGMTMVIVTHEMAFAGDVANKVIFMEDGQIKESGSPAEILVTPSSERLKLFLSRHLR
jgi:ABC-type polar amino acid transport system ATPase subunit